MDNGCGGVDGFTDAEFAVGVISGGAGLFDVWAGDLRSAWDVVPEDV